MKNLFVLFLSVFLWACSNAQVKNINADEFEKAIEQLDANEILLDVRSKKEVKAGYIKGMQNIDFYASDFEEKIAALDKSKTYYVYCAAGGRSTKAANAMQKNGIKNVVNLNGGITAWKNKGKTVTTK